MMEILIFHCHALVEVVMVVVERICKIYQRENRLSLVKLMVDVKL